MTPVRLVTGSDRDRRVPSPQVGNVAAMPRDSTATGIDLKGSRGPIVETALHLRELPKTVVASELLGNRRHELRRGRRNALVGSQDIAVRVNACNGFFNLDGFSRES